MSVSSMRVAAGRGRWWLQHLAVKQRLRSLRRPVEPGVTVASVNFNSLPFMQTLVAAVEHFADRPVRFVIVDNASTDGSRDWLASRPDITAIFPGENLGHGRGMDLAWLAAATEYVVAMDIDAFPISRDWLPAVLGPIERGEATISGAHNPVEHTWLGRDYVHPCCLAMRQRRFVTRGHSFDMLPGQWDNGERLTLAEQAHGGRAAFLDVTELRGPGIVGAVFGGVVYHNFYSTRFTVQAEQVLDGDVTPDDPRRAWQEATARHLAGLRV